MGKDSELSDRWIKWIYKWERERERESEGDLRMKRDCGIAGRRERLWEKLIEGRLGSMTG